jgi:protein-L-isoaspartate(D-aspartate) O-methyltransferase
MSPPGSETTSTEDDPYPDRRADMVERQLRRRGIGDERVLAAMAEVPRERFVPEDERRQAYRDGALRIGEGQTISQPWIVAAMTELLELEGHERVLEIGTGSGYAAAVLSRMCREVVTIERHESLAETAREVLRDLGYANVEVRVGDGAEGAPDKAPFGGISVTATAIDRPPRALLDQRAPGAALVGPVDRGGRELLMRFRDGIEEAFAAVRFVPLISE